MRKVLLTMENRGYNYSVILEYLNEKGFSADWKPITTGKPEEIIEKARGYDAVIAGVEKWSREAMSEVRNSVRIIARYGIGYDSVDLDAATEFGIAVTNTPGTMSGGVAELAMQFMLNLSRKTCEFNHRLKSGQWWQGYTGIQLEGKTVGIIGFGHIGRKLAKYLQGFSCNILVYDKYVDSKALKELSAEYASLDDIAHKSDYISLHAPATDETRGMINEAFLLKMKPTAFLINTSRGALVKEEDLIYALQQGIIAGAGLDVFEKEPLSFDHPILKLDNVIVTPHIASATIEGAREAGICAADNIIDLFQRRQPRNLLNSALSLNLVFERL
ncbi:MAG TPA: phosphoglycerate dehydrogenase [Ruminiclostridium sp.]